MPWSIVGSEPYHMFEQAVSLEGFFCVGGAFENSLFFAYTDWINVSENHTRCSTGEPFLLGRLGSSFFTWLGTLICGVLTDKTMPTARVDVQCSKCWSREKWGPCTLVSDWLPKVHFCIVEPPILDRRPQEFSWVFVMRVFIGFTSFQWLDAWQFRFWANKRFHFFIPVLSLSTCRRREAALHF